MSVAKRTSLLVIIPTSFPPFRSTTGNPEMRCFFFREINSSSAMSGVTVMGLITIPDSNRLTLRTSSACRATSRLRWITPSPPAWAIAIASFASVTVSIAAEIRGIFSSTSLVNFVVVSASVGKTEDAAGFIRTSSNVSASSILILGPWVRTSRLIYRY